MLLSIDEIRSERNVRQDVEADGLTSSMGMVGQIVPITVRDDGAGGYIVISGHRRLAAARELGWTEIEAVVKGSGSESDLAMQIAENVVREDLRPFEYAQGVLALKEESGLTQEQIADVLGINKKDVSDLQKVAKGAEGLDPVKMNQLSWDELEVFSQVHDMPAQMRPTFAEKIAETDVQNLYWTVNDYVEEVARWRWSQKKENKALIKALTDIGAMELDREATFGSQFLDESQIAAHRGETCHGWYVRKAWSQDGRRYEYTIDEYCIDPARHREDEKPELAEMAAERPVTASDAAQKARDRIRRKNKIARKEAVLTFSGKPRMRELTEMMYTALLNMQPEYRWQELGKTFGLTKPEDEFHFDWSQYLDGFKGKERLVQQLILAVGSWYLTLEGTYSVGRSELVRKMDGLFGAVLEEEDPSWEEEE